MTNDSVEVVSYDVSEKDTSVAEEITVVSG